MPGHILRVVPSHHQALKSPPFLESGTEKIPYEALLDLEWGLLDGVVHYLDIGLLTWLKSP
jgi:hypothetical protein